jgi:hypothetical protein
MLNEPERIWATIPIRGIDLGDRTEAQLADDLSLVASHEQFRAIANDLGPCLSSIQSNDVGNAKWFLVLRVPQTQLRSVDVPQCIEHLQDALMAFQIVKPIETYGLIFHGIEQLGDQVRWQGVTDRRWPMIAGEWARLRAFDEPLLNEVRTILSRVREVMKGRDIAKRNGIHSLQLALEHPHPYVACLLAVMGMEAILDSCDRLDFERKICDLLGATTPAFPDWNVPDFSPPKYSVKDLAVHLYTLRSKVAHGVDLKKAAHDKNSPVDLLEYKEYIVTGSSGYDQRSEPVQYAMLLGEAAIYLLGRVLQKVLCTP